MLIARREISLLALLMRYPGRSERVGRSGRGAVVFGSECFEGGGWLDGWMEGWRLLFWVCFSREMVVVCAWGL